MKADKKYSADDLIFDFLVPKEDDEDEVPFEEVDTNDSDDDWLSAL